ncbi:cytochrome P450 [Jatrophihabitans sp. GAS493]|uniref:cytochrome P450 n=1 Tax=Jatrophihabitans sp. GAS493 TaxID=1907575 RepID=UPI000BBF9DAB|nr:cytochrome P450 [Jatrophihabitans sp. GAS493]SOD71779.1 cytochrome P450 [Jatrophihabitans sp. GAS493]
MTISPCASTTPATVSDGDDPGRTGPSGLNGLALLPVDLQSVDVLECPYPAYKTLRESAPVFHSDRGYWVVTRYEDVAAILLDTARFSGYVPRPPDAEIDAILDEGYPEIPTLISADAPMHSQYRALVNKAFLPGRVAQLESEIAAIADELIDRFIDAGRVELIGQFAVGLPLTVIADALGVSRADLPTFKRWSDDIVAPRSGLLTRPELLAATRSLVEMQQYMAQRCEQRRREPRDDLLTDLVQATFDAGDRAGEQLSLNEVIGIIRQLLVAGNETTTSLIANVMTLLIEHPEQMQAVRADSAQLTPIIEESLRLDAPIQMLPRRARVDVEIGGTRVAAGDLLYVVYASANHDESRFAVPAEFDPQRANIRKHLAFGKGAHFCVGASLARGEARIAFERLLSRATDWALATDRDEPVRRGLSMQLRGLSHLDLTFRAR